MEKLMIFTDGSLNTLTKVGYGAYLVTNTQEFNENLNVLVKRFENTSSTKLELQTLLWALNEIKNLDCKIEIYTDSQNIIGLNSRREKLEQNNYCSLSGKVLSNSELYKEFYLLNDKLNCDFIKVTGHLASTEKNDIDKIFTLVDRASRNALRKSKD
jgi:ribonuclease HI